ncbi:MAG: hypothetical protein PHG82_03895 [Candidatus Gracilibacteria bacterium]|nr:hypothetical protein [Candidatus Gracilibacteria bacterium]
MGNYLDKNDILILKNTKPSSVIDVLSDEELNILKKYEHSEIEIKTPIDSILISVRNKIFKGIELPDDFPSYLLPIGDNFNDYSINIGIVLENEETNINKIEEWIIDELSTHNNVAKNKVRDILRFKPRIWFDGPISVNIIYQRDIEKISKKQFS